MNEISEPHSGMNEILHQVGVCTSDAQKHAARLPGLQKWRSAIEEMILQRGEVVDIVAKYNREQAALISLIDEEIGLNTAKADLNTPWNDLTDTEYLSERGQWKRTMSLLKAEHPVTREVYKAVQHERRKRKNAIYSSERRKKYKKENRTKTVDAVAIDGGLEHK
tara:strand:+ start:444 stop:938 length:495 start_codon:yes stop_codon:yes gene_type:complete